MKPQLGWVWLSQTERSAAEQCLSEASAEGTRDELGFSVIHFAYADRFFPGTSVQHTRLRYVWFICWAYSELLDRYPGGAFPEDALKAIEYRTGHKLIGEYGPVDGTGIIGGRVLRAKRRPVTRPSRVYWNAVRTWGLLAPLERTGAPPSQSELHWRWDEIGGRGKGPEVDGEKTAPAIFLDPPPIPPGWASAKVPLSFDLDRGHGEDDRIRASWAGCRGPDGRVPLMARLADRRKPAPRSMTAKAVFDLCSADERGSLRRAEQAASLVCLARALYAAMVGDMKRDDGHDVPDPGPMLDQALDGHGPPALALDLRQLARDVPMLGPLEPLLDGVQQWAGRGGGGYRHLQPVFTLREVGLKGARALLDPASSARREQWWPGEPLPLTYRWEKVASFLNELGPAA